MGAMRVMMSASTSATSVRTRARSTSARARTIRSENFRGRRSPRAVADSVASEARSPGVLYDDAVVGADDAFTGILEAKSEILRGYVDEVEAGTSTTEGLDEANTAAEWIRQALVKRIETGGRLQPAQAQVLLGDTVENLCSLAQEGSVEALCALQAICYRNASACWKVGSTHNMFAYFRTMCIEGADEPVRCAGLFLASTLVAFNEDLHRVVAKSRFTPVLLQQLQNKCQKAACNVEWRDVRGLSECDHGLCCIRNLSQNAAQTKLLTSNGAVELCGNFLKSHTGVGRVNAAISIANMIGREDNDERLSADETIMEELCQLFAKALDGQSYDNLKHTVWKYTQGIANAATMESLKKRLAKAGVIPLLVRVLREKQHQWDRASFWAAAALWNLAFDDEVKEQIIAEPGVMEALEEAKRLGSENTKMKVRGALWMLKPPEEPTSEEASKKNIGLSEEDIQKLGGIQNAKAQVMLSYEWHHQAQVMQLKEQLNARGFNVWMDVDRMMGSTLEAMAAAIESSDAIIMCISARYKESQACRTEAEYAYTRKKTLIPVKVEKGYDPDGWLGILVGSKLYYNVYNSDMMSQAIPGIVTAVEAIHNDSKAPKFLQKNGEATVNVSPPDMSASAASAPPSVTNSSFKTSSSNEVSVPADDDAMERWLDAVGLMAYVHVFKYQHIYGKTLLKMHQELGQLTMAEQHVLLLNILGIQSYGHRLLFLTELEELVGPLDGKLRKQASITVPPPQRIARGPVKRTTSKGPRE